MAPPSSLAVAVPSVVVDAGVVEQYFVAATFGFVVAPVFLDAESAPVHTDDTRRTSRSGSRAPLHLILRRARELLGRPILRRATPQRTLRRTTLRRAP